MLNVYEQVAQNKLRSNLIIFLFITFIIGVTSALVYIYNLDISLLVFSLIFSLFSAFSSYFYGDKIITTLNGAKPATKEMFFDYYTVTENLSIGSGLPMPRLYIIDSHALNAFATGRNPENALICVTTGLLNALNRTELESVIAHELSHIQNFDIRLMMVVSILIGSLSIFINIFTRNTFFNRRNKGKEGNSGGIFAIIGIILIILAPLIAQLIQLAISRRREYLADASGVKLTRQPSSLISALKKISADNNVLETASTATANLYIKNPFKGNKIASLFSTHPPIEDRITALQQMF